MSRPWRVAVVGSGPAGMYAAGHLVGHDDGPFAAPRLAEDPGGDRAVEVDVYDRLPTPWGLVRSGVAPDHPETRGITRVFDAVAAHPGVAFVGNVEVGRDVGTGELARWYDAVIYAHGAADGRRLDVPGADRRGVHTAHDVVAWYNGRPGWAGYGIDLAADRAVIVGTGNVALDVARMLALPPASLRSTDVAGHAEAALQASSLAEIVVVGRRGPEHAAFGVDAIEAIVAGGIDVEVDPADLPPDRPVPPAIEALRRAAARPPTGHPRRIVFRFGHRPVAIDGDPHVTGIRLRADRDTHLGTSLVIAAVGHRSRALPGLPFDATAHVLPTRDGRVVDAGGAVVPGAYAAGWVRRGATGKIGTNRACARETVTSLVADARAGRLPTAGTLTGPEVRRALAGRRLATVGWRGWRAIDLVETTRGRAEGRPRRKLVGIDEMLAVARSSRRRESDPPVRRGGRTRR